jgi:hypothetical protein
MPYITQRVESAMEQIPTISSVNSYYKQLEIVYLGNGVIKFNQIENTKTLAVFNLEGKNIPIKWLTESTLFIEPREQVVIINSSASFKKIVLID